jgi:DNA-binding NtrC family response regulator
MTARSSEGPADTRRRARVLVADDEPELREVIGELLVALGYDVVFAETAIGALGAVKTSRPDVVLLDLMMPGAVTGDAVISAISALVPVIVMSAVTDIDRARRTLQEGAFDFLMKPVSFQRLNEVVAAAILHGSADPSAP